MGRQSHFIALRHAPDSPFTDELRTSIARSFWLAIKEPGSFFAQCLAGKLWSLDNLCLKEELLPDPKSGKLPTTGHVLSVLCAHSAALILEIEIATAEGHLSLLRELETEARHVEADIGTLIKLVNEFGEHARLDKPCENCAHTGAKSYMAFFIAFGFRTARLEAMRAMIGPETSMRTVQRNFGRLRRKP